LSKYIESVNIDRLDNVIAPKAGKLLAEFHEALLDLSVSELEYTIPDFHNTEKRFLDLNEQTLTASEGRTLIAKEEIDFLLSHYAYFKELLLAINDGEIPLRVVHNDTKVSNILFDKEQQPLCLIDLDTVMPGSFLYDVGDALRSGANTSDENEQDISKVNFDRGVYEGFMASYMSVGESFLSESEKKYLPLALPLILFEQACRFLEDYLRGDVYYRIDYPNQNLIRTRTQIKLLREVLNYLDGH
jgi:N-acetylhexosamine 1-kinase